MKPDNDRFTQRILNAGLDPKKDCVNIPIRKISYSLKEIANWFDSPREHPLPDAHAPKNVEEVKKASMQRIYTWSQNHVYGHTTITDENIIKAIDERASAYISYFRVGGDETTTVTAEKPLIINTAGSRWIYNKILIKDGGYIKITASGAFSCEEIKKSDGGGGSKSSAYDIFVVGEDGETPGTPPTPDTPTDAKNGNGAECDCCGGLVSSDATNGANGEDGSPGVPGQNGGSGSTGPTVVLDLGNVATRGITILNRGGNGGSGGAGGNGGKGGKGGKGGGANTCGAYFPDAGNGGNGGNGANGGSGGNGGNGGNGASLTIHCNQDTAQNLIVVNQGAPGGGIGAGGQVGPGGDAGASGGRGGNPGKAGSPGTMPGNPGMSAGDAGGVGVSTINGTPVN